MMLEYKITATVQQGGKAKAIATRVSAIVKDYAMKQNKEKFETELKEKISAILK